MKLAYSINEAIHEIGIKRTKIYQEINAGKIKTRKIGKRTVILAEDLCEYLENLPAAM